MKRCSLICLTDVSVHDSIVVHVFSGVNNPAGDVRDVLYPVRLDEEMVNLKMWDASKEPAWCVSLTEKVIRYSPN